MESGGTGLHVGYWERHDVSQVVDQIRSVRGSDTTRMVLFGVGVGAAIATAAAALRNDLMALVLESPPADCANAARLYMDRSADRGDFFQLLLCGSSSRMSAAAIPQCGRSI